MTFKQYTQCIEPADFRSRVRYITIASLLAGTPAALIAVAMGHPVCLVIALEITALAALVAYYHNWLYHRLICLGGDKDCLGVIVSISPPTLTLNLLDRDTDYSINLLLQNNEYGGTIDDQPTRETLQAAAEESIPYGELVAPYGEVTAIGLETPGHFAKDKQTDRLAAVLHAEFEGDGNYKMLQACKVLLALAIFALVACVLGGPVLWLVLLIASLIILLFTSLLGLSGGGSPSDVNAGNITDNTGVNENGQGIGASVLYVQGTWVYDTLHEGWNEIHPIKICMNMGCWKGDWTSYTGKCEDNEEPTPTGIILRLRHGFQLAQAEETIANQARPEHRWQIHPDLDGCARDVIL